MNTNFISGYTPANPRKYIQGDREPKADAIRDVLLGHAASPEVRAVADVLEKIDELQERAQRTPVMSKEAAIMLKAISKSLDSMTGSLITSLGMKSQNDIVRTVNEMRARCVCYSYIIPEFRQVPA